MSVDMSWTLGLPLIALVLGGWLGVTWSRRIKKEAVAASMAVSPDPLTDCDSHYRTVSKLTSDMVFSYELLPDGLVQAAWQEGTIEGLPEPETPETQETPETNAEGRSSDGLIWMDRVIPEDRDLLEVRDWRLRDGRATTDEFRLQIDPDTVRWVRVFSQPEPLAEGGFRIAGAVKEITQEKQWECALAESESKLQVTSRIAQVGYLEYWPKTDRAICSPVIWRIWGLKPGEVGRSAKFLIDAVHEDDRDAIRAVFDNPETQNRIECRIVRPSGDVRHVNQHFTVELDDQGKPEKFFGVCQDITDQKRAEQRIAASEALYQAVIEDQTDLIRRCTPDGRRTFVNKAYCEMYNRTPDELIGSRIGTHLPQDFSDDLVSALATLNADQPTLDRVFPVRLPNGEIAYQHWHERAILNDVGEVVEIQGVGRDITHLKVAEFEVAKARDEAEQASASKSRFLAAASHDLRQPLQALTLFTSVLQAQDLDDKSRDLVMRVAECGEALQRLLGALLDISKLDAGLFNPQIDQFSLPKTLAQLAREMAPLAEKKGLEFRLVDASVYVETDPGLLDRILRNLVTNAIRYTNRGRVLLGCKRSGAQIAVQVWDTGPGIPEEQLDLIFEEFHQVGNEARDRSEGLGLGLAIVKRLADLLGLEINVRSRVGVGTVFEVLLPISGIVEAPEVLAEPVQQTQAGARMIVAIDDEADIRDALRRLLEIDGHQVVVGESASHAFAELLARGIVPQLIIADYRLKDGNGIDAIRALRAHWGREIPAFLLTGDTAPERLREVSTSGFQVMHKPIEADELRRTIKETLELSETSDKNPSGRSAAE